MNYNFYLDVDYEMKMLELESERIIKDLKMKQAKQLKAKWLQAKRWINKQIPRYSSKEKHANEIVEKLQEKFKELDEDEDTEWKQIRRNRKEEQDRRSARMKVIEPEILKKEKAERRIANKIIIWPKDSKPDQDVEYWCEKGAEMKETMDELKEEANTLFWEDIEASVMKQMEVFRQSQSKELEKETKVREGLSSTHEHKLGVLKKDFERCMQTAHDSRERKRSATLERPKSAPAGSRWVDRAEGFAQSRDAAHKRHEWEVADKSQKKLVEIYSPKTARKHRQARRYQPKYYTAQWKRIVKKKEKEISDTKTQLLRRHKREIVLYRKSCERDLRNGPVRFSKHQKEELRHLELAEKRLANSRLYQEARVVQQKIECLRKRGSQMHKKQIPKEVSKLARKLQKKQRLEVDRFEREADKELRMLKKDLWLQMRSKQAKERDEPSESILEDNPNPFPFSSLDAKRKNDIRRVENRSLNSNFSGFGTSTPRFGFTHSVIALPWQLSQP